MLWRGNFDDKFCDFDDYASMLRNGGLNCDIQKVDELPTEEGEECNTAVGE